MSFFLGFHGARADAERSLSALHKVAYDQWLEPAHGVRARFWNAGHILGSSSIEIELQILDSKGLPSRLLFSGDLGPAHKSFHPDPSAPEGFDYVITESTYGGRDRPNLTPQARRDELRAEVLAAMKRGGNLLIPAFAIEQTQELILDLAELFRRKALPPITVYIDFPGEKILTPHLDDRFDLREGILLPPPARRLAPESVTQPDWSHLYSSTTLELKRRLDALPNDEARKELLERVGKALR